MGARSRLECRLGNGIDGLGLRFTGSNTIRNGTVSPPPPGRWDSAKFRLGSGTSLHEPLHFPASKSQKDVLQKENGKFGIFEGYIATKFGIGFKQNVPQILIFAPH